MNNEPQQIDVQKIVKHWIDSATSDSVTMDSKQVVETAQQYLRILPKDKYHIKRAFLFVSYARNTQYEGSDIDIAIILYEVEDLLQTQFDLMKLRRAIDLRIEPHPIDENDFTSNHPLADEILAHGAKRVRPARVSTRKPPQKAGISDLHAVLLTPNAS